MTIIDQATRLAVIREICNREGHGDLVDVTTFDQLGLFEEYICQRGCGIHVLKVVQAITPGELHTYLQRRRIAGEVRLRGGVEITPPGLNTGSSCQSMSVTGPPRRGIPDKRPLAQVRRRARAGARRYMPAIRADAPTSGTSYAMTSATVRIGSRFPPTTTDEGRHGPYMLALHTTHKLLALAMQLCVHIVLAKNEAMAGAANSRLRAMPTTRNYWNSLPLAVSADDVLEYFRRAGEQIAAIGAVGNVEGITVHYSPHVPPGQVYLIDRARIEENLRRGLQAGATYSLTANDEASAAFRANSRSLQDLSRHISRQTLTRARIRRIHHAYRQRQLAKRRRGRR